MFKIKTGKYFPLNLLANQFYTKMNPVTKGGALHKNALTKRIMKAHKTEKDPAKKRFYHQLCTKKCRKLREIITGAPDRLTTIAADMDRLQAAGLIPALYRIENGSYVSTDFGEEVLNLFGYKAARGSIKFIWLVEQLDSRICTYCNDEHTFKIKRANDEIILHDFDHFLPKVTYPYLSLSFFNLIPSCHNCNSILKGSSQFNVADYVHPYVDDLDSFSEFDTDNPVTANLSSFSVQLNPITSDPGLLLKLQNHKKIFAIEGRYDHFKGELLRLNGFRPIYTETYKQQLLKNGLNPLIFKDRTELITFIGNHINVPVDVINASRTDRGKFKKDMAYKLELTK